MPDDKTKHPDSNGVKHRGLCFHCNLGVNVPEMFPAQGEVTHEAYDGRRSGGDTCGTHCRMCCKGAIAGCFPHGDNKAQRKQIKNIGL